MSDLFGTHITGEITAKDALEELQREKGMRFGYYPKAVARGTLSPREVDHRAAALDLAIAIVRERVVAEGGL
jgi:hypothetical protein